MGVEYKHYFLARYPEWNEPAREVIPRIHALLQEWSLVTESPDCFDLQGGRCMPLPSGIAGSPIPHNMGLSYGDPDWTSPERQGALEKILGPSLAPIEGSRYLHNVSVVAGIDIRVHGSDQSLYVSVADPPPLEAVDFPFPFRPFDATVLRKIGTPWPVAQVDYGDERGVPDGFGGLWRFALVLDCGKDLPAFIMGKSHRAPGSEFRQALQNALRSEVVEIGSVY